ncbi:SCO family protein [Flavobacterium humi]|uniref:Thioredoxin domain-containing protein n=1 Tax=Flavobacterium humi TaxID=2562683 RepID=A0A4Z0LA50_9FLAO|nr:SCO family protein [Flavobacterium humi]TGD57928.1 hypothetical protein E4635_07920 [Flavobacterium humi]
MKKLYAIALLFTVFNAPLYCQMKDGDGSTNTAGLETSEEALAKYIKNANGQDSFAQLAALTETAKANFSDSASITENLSFWLAENHPIYDGKGFNEALQFRAYLLHSFSFFPANDRILGYLISELTFSDNQNIVCAAVFTSKKYHDSRLIPLIEKLATDAYRTTVNFSDFQYNTVYNYKTTIQEEAKKALDALKTEEVPATSHKPSCCSSKMAIGKESPSKLIGKKDRMVKDLNITFLDQENDFINLKNTHGSPFIVTFFYTSCTNQNKCAATISKLSELQKSLVGKKNKFKIYAITYDEYVDKPDVLKKYGGSYNFMFDKNNKFLLSADKEEKEKMDQLFNTTVNYGNGIVNQHGIQLFLFDKHGKIASVIENENWTVPSVSDKINTLLEE